MLILLPPSEGKTAPRRGAALDLSSLSLPSLTAARSSVIEALTTLCAGDPAVAMATLGVPKSQPELVSLNAALREAPTARADAIYTGVLYDALDPSTLSTAAKRRAASRVMVTSSVFGLVGMGDRIPAYRLSGDTALPGLGGVQAHWRRHLGSAAVEALGGGLLVDLRSGTYAAFWRPDEVAPRTATVRVLHEVDGVRKVVSHFNKATKGRLVRALLESGATPRTPAALAGALRDLGWSVEVGEPGRSGTQLDVVIAEL
ncbi:peroxide stress protein YaaA [Nocardioides sp. BP30]|uniref:peroxide stress protein YaaA n=1 Tax=Nocardioides sp. BP30 TaxID=3036374 RepID=UPI002468326E|nr:peroxide stress protein YaaA [Nocardioides sp. BP30]WGL51055.1 peroxide stress protein YaaA [Nocardioides sp. BP30]